jgi:hypothetical protein
MKSCALLLMHRISSARSVNGIARITQRSNAPSGLFDNTLPIMPMACFFTQKYTATYTPNVEQDRKREKVVCGGFGDADTQIRPVHLQIISIKLTLNAERNKKCSNI